MDAAHVRPLTAYLGLCAAASFVLAQGISGAPLAGPEIARAGDPATLIANAVTVTFDGASQVFGSVTPELVAAPVVLAPAAPLAVKVATPVVDRTVTVVGASEVGKQPRTSAPVSPTKRNPGTSTGSTTTSKPGKYKKTDATPAQRTTSTQTKGAHAAKKDSPKSTRSAKSTKPSKAKSTKPSQAKSPKHKA